MKAKTEINTLKEENEQLKEASESQGLRLSRFRKEN